MRNYIAVGALALGLTGAATLPAQSPRERDIERLSDRIGRAIERSIEGAMRGVEEAMRRLDGYRGRESREGGQGGESVDSTFSFARDGTVDLSSISGVIIVTGWTRNEARVRASTERGRLRWRFGPTRLTLETESVRGRVGETKYEVSVPEGSRVLLRSTSGDLMVRGVRGAVSANSTSGDIDVVDAGDRIELSTISGEVRGARLRGEVDASSVSGSVELEDVQGRAIHVESTSGDLAITNARSPDVSASTVSGEVEYAGAIETGGQYEFQSHSGSITLAIPETASVRFSVETFSGSLVSDFPVTLQPNRDRARNQRQGRSLEFSLGGGDARVIAETFSGSVEIRRAARR